MDVTPGRYQDTQNRGREGVQTANALVGSPVGSTHQSSVAGTAPAANTFSTRPYKPPTRKSRHGALLCVAKENSCLGPRARGTLFCIGHLRQMGLAGDQNDAKEPKEIVVE